MGLNCGSFFFFRVTLPLILLCVLVRWDGSARAPVCVHLCCAAAAGGRLVVARVLVWLLCTCAKACMPQVPCVFVTWYITGQWIHASLLLRACVADASHAHTPLAACRSCGVHGRL